MLEIEMTDRQEQSKESETEVESTESIGENYSVKKCSVSSMCNIVMRAHCVVPMVNPLSKRDYRGA